MKSEDNHRKITSVFWQKTLEKSNFLFIVAAVSVKKVGSLSYFVDSILRNTRV